MSSHYIVREDQAPALVIYQSWAVTDHVILSLLEWNPLVVVEESSLSFVLHNRINVDAVILNQMNEADVNELLGYQQPYELIAACEFPVKLADYLVSQGSKAVDLIGEFDLSTIKLAQTMESNFPVFIYADHMKYIHLRQGFFRKWSSPGRGFTIVPGEYESDVEFMNLESVGNGNYKVRKEGMVEIKTNAPVWVGEVIS